MLFETERGCLLAALDATSITAIRTAAVSGVATRRLAREESATLAILGSGVQARTHLEAMRLARGVSEVRVWSRSESNAKAFADREASRHGIAVEVAATAREAVAGADVICTTTSSREPVLEGGWISPGAHVNAVGACVPAARELDTAAVVASRLFVDRRESTLNEAGDFRIPRDEGAIEENHILAEIGEVLIGRYPGRRSEDEITLFKSLGIAVEDLAAAHHVWRRAEATDAGTLVDFGGRRE
jgi:ornithine cyclodeaminase